MMCVRSKHSTARGVDSGAQNGRCYGTRKSRSGPPRLTARTGGARVTEALRHARRELRGQEARQSLGQKVVGSFSFASREASLGRQSVCQSVSSSW